MSALHDGMAGFDERVLPGLLAIHYYRRAPPSELAPTFEAYAGGDGARLLEVWRTACDPTRATVGGPPGWMYRRAGILPAAVTGCTFLATLRAVLDAGQRFQRRLRPATARAIQDTFPWLSHRHQHVPPGYTPPLDFPAAFLAFVDADDVEDARARWQLLAVLNEVQQSSYSQHLARLFRSPPLLRHAERERELALNYLGHWRPRVTGTLWTQVVHVLDGLNAAVFEMCREWGGTIARKSLRAALRRPSEWHHFVARLDEPQRLLA